MHFWLPHFYGRWGEAFSTNATHPDGGQKLNIPSTVKRILFQLGPPEGLLCSRQWPSYQRELDQYRPLETKDDHIIILHLDEGEGNIAGELEAEWQDRLNGGKGCWNTVRQWLPILLT
jgi:hypothetical protein